MNGKLKELPTRGVAKITPHVWLVFGRTDSDEILKDQGLYDLIYNRADECFRKQEKGKELHCSAVAITDGGGMVVAEIMKELSGELSTVLVCCTPEAVKSKEHFAFMEKVLIVLNGKERMVETAVGLGKYFNPNPLAHWIPKVQQRLGRTNSRK